MISDGHGVQIGAHRVPHLLETGKKPEYIRHKCDNKLCVRPDHLIPTSAAEGAKLNSQESYDRGRRTATRGGSKRTAEDIKEIRRRCAEGESQATVGESYGIDQSTVSRIVRLTSWRDVL